MQLNSIDFDAQAIKPGPFRLQLAPVSEYVLNKRKRARTVGSLRFNEEAGTYLLIESKTVAE